MSEVERFWNAFRVAEPALAGPDATYTAWHFCDNQADADELADLVLAGRKRATAGALWSYEAEGEPLPRPGDLSVVTDWSGTPRCVIRTTSVEVVPFGSVTEEFAAAEGEGDGSLDYWRRAHRAAFEREAVLTGRAPSEEMPVVCERFEVVYPYSIRPARASDLPAILALNAEWEHVTSPLDGASLATLHEHAAYHAVAEVGSRVRAFLLALAPGAPYESPNYRWFEDHSAGFLYIDRIVVTHAHQRSGLGDALYRDLLSYAGRCGIERLVCEVDAEPLNAASDAFHSRRGFVEVGTQVLPDGKRVSLRELSIP
ncbi:GNAT family N-acetyltransferase [Anaerosoma tenue]|uniref:GNAT family N-acetyltransferase n=1 Tax=Anaerosoma tenue TaxID=2933588 RepID=UPI0022608574|nr:GNAT family N-acetyltransferase [Anaerosoma tenue]MCK8115729.1 GNAT family N-acetyltransferase [Anaerosoma tenue]